MRIVSRNCKVIWDIWGSYGDAYQDDRLLGCYTMYLGDGGIYIPLHIIGFVNNIALGDEAWVPICARRVKYKMDKV
jgi:hypothetical protein